MVMARKSPFQVGHTFGVGIRGLRWVDSSEVLQFGAGSGLSSDMRMAGKGRSGIVMAVSYFLHGYHTSLRSGATAIFMLGGMPWNIGCGPRASSSFRVGMRKRYADIPVCAAGVCCPTTLPTMKDCKHVLASRVHARGSRLTWTPSAATIRSFLCVEPSASFSTPDSQSTSTT